MLGLASDGERMLHDVYFSGPWHGEKLGCVDIHKSTYTIHEARRLAMQKRQALRSGQWERTKNALPGKKCGPGRTAGDSRKFIEPAMWTAKTGAPWRGLPPERGKWPAVYKRFIRWAKKGIWQMIFNTLASDADTEWLMIDGAIVRARHSAPLAEKGAAGPSYRAHKGQACFKSPRHVRCPGQPFGLHFDRRRAGCAQALNPLDGKRGGLCWQANAMAPIALRRQ